MRVTKLFLVIRSDDFEGFRLEDSFNRSQFEEDTANFFGYLSNKYQKFTTDVKEIKPKPNPEGTSKKYLEPTST